MNSRSEILKDSDFWLRLEFGMSLQPEKNEKIPRYWIDGFIPEHTSNTKKGINVEGRVCIVDGMNPEYFTFEASIPQKLLHKRINEFEYEVTLFSPEEKQLTFEIRPIKHQQNQASSSVIS